MRLPASVRSIGMPCADRAPCVLRVPPPPRHAGGFVVAALPLVDDFAKLALSQVLLDRGLLTVWVMMPHPVIPHPLILIL